MLFDPKWERKADVNSLASLTTWLEQRPPNKHYHYLRGGSCALQQYYTDKGYEAVRMGGYSMSYILDGDRVTRSLPTHFDDVAGGDPSFLNLMAGILHLPVRLWTFGEAAQRAREFA